MVQHISDGQSPEDIFSFSGLWAHFHYHHLHPSTHFGTLCFQRLWHPKRLVLGDRGWPTGMKTHAHAKASPRAITAGLATPLQHLISCAPQKMILCFLMFPDSLNLRAFTWLQSFYCGISNPGLKTEMMSLFTSEVLLLPTPQGMSESQPHLSPVRQHQDVAEWQLAIRIAAALPDHK